MFLYSLTLSRASGIQVICIACKRRLQPARHCRGCFWIDKHGSHQLANPPSSPLGAVATGHLGAPLRLLHVGHVTLTHHKQINPSGCYNRLRACDVLRAQCAIYGNFSAPKAQEVVVSRGKVLELLRPDESGKMQTILATEVFGAIRALVPFRLTGGSRDYIIIGSDSGRIVIVDYNKEKNAFIKVQTADNSRSVADAGWCWHKAWSCGCMHHQNTHFEVSGKMTFGAPL